MQNNNQANFLLKLKILEAEMNEEDYSGTIKRHLDALVEDIGNIEGVVNVLNSNFDEIVNIEIQTDLEKKELKDILNIYQAREIDYFTFLSLDTHDY